MAAAVNSAKRSVSLLWRILLATSLAITAVFAVTGWMVQRYAASVSQRSLEEEVRTSLQAYEALWGARVHNLASVSRVFSSMSDVRSAFMTRDGATIRDTAAQLWSQISEANASFLVLDPTGAQIASLGGDPDFSISAGLMDSVVKRFPNQISGYIRRGSHLFYVVFTPVYVQAAHGQELLNVLLVAFDINDSLAEALKNSTHGSNFAFTGSDVVFASTLPIVTARDFNPGQTSANRIRRMRLHGADYLLLGIGIEDPSGNPIGKLFIIRSFGSQQAVLFDLQRKVAVFWAAAILVALALTYLLARRILEPVRRLDWAAEQIIRQNYAYRVPVETNDELGRLAFTFNAMCESIEGARADLVRQERIATIGRLSSSIVHDLRNPLAAIYGGAEMLVDADLSPEQSKRLAANIYTASRRIQQLLQELVDVSRARTRASERCGLVEIISGAITSVSRTAEAQQVEIKSVVSTELEVDCDRDRLERVFLNLINNALEAMLDGGSVRISASIQGAFALVEVEDSGPGIPDELWANLFEPFASFGKRNGLGLGLALSRQTLLDLGGDLWAEKTTSPGARILMRLPLARRDRPIGNADGFPEPAQQQS